MRRTKEWWHRLSKPERAQLVYLEGSSSWSYCTGGGSQPDDCPECDGCGQPQLGSGLCSNCSKELQNLIDKADGKKGD